MPNPYPIRIQGSDGIATLNGEATFTDPANQPGGGGSSSIKAVRFAFVYNTPNLLTGIVAYSGKAGDILLGLGGGGQGSSAFFNVPTPWNGTTPRFEVQPDGDPAGQLGNGDATAANSASGSTGLDSIDPATSFLTTQLVLTADTDITVIVDDGAGGDPGSNQGAAEFVLLVIPAA